MDEWTDAWMQPHPLAKIFWAKLIRFLGKSNKIWQISAKFEQK